MVISIIKPITVSVEGVTGITTRSGQDFQCKIQPVFRGHIDSIDDFSGELIMDLLKSSISTDNLSLYLKVVN